MRREYPHIDLTPPAGDEVVLPLPRKMTPGDWLRRGAIALILAVAMLLLLWFDVALMRRRCEWIGEPDGLFRSLLGGFREVGEFFLVLVAFGIIATFDRRRWFIIGAVILAELLSAGLFNLGKEFVNRERPYQFITVEKDDEGRKFVMFEPGESRWRSWQGDTADNRSNHYRSFPSGHTAAAFAFMTTLVWFYPRLAWLLWLLAVGCGLSRFLDAQHWLSDCLAGAVIGYASAWMVLRPYAWVLPIIWWRRRVKRRQAARRKEHAASSAS